MVVRGTAWEYDRWSYHLEVEVAAVMRRRWGIDMGLAAAGCRSAVRHSEDQSEEDVARIDEPDVLV